jgi:hypothetical protein
VTLSHLITLLGKWVGFTSAGKMCHCSADYVCIYKYTQLSRGWLVYTSHGLLRVTTFNVRSVQICWLQSICKGPSQNVVMCNYGTKIILWWVVYRCQLLTIMVIVPNTMTIQYVIYHILLSRNCQHIIYLMIINHVAFWYRQYIYVFYFYETIYTFAFQ